MTHWMHVCWVLIMNKNRRNSAQHKPAHIYEHECRNVSDHIEEPRWREGAALLRAVS